MATMTKRILLATGFLVLIVAAFVAFARLTSRSVDSIGCDPTENVTYHVHAHLTIMDRGKISYPPAGVGIHPEHLCLYWLHTHLPYGVIHIEAPHRFTPTLGQFFDIWGEPLSRTQVWTFHVGPGESMKVYVDRKPYPGNPRDIPLFNHTAVTIEIGPPFKPAPIPDFSTG